MSEMSATTVQTLMSRIDGLLTEPADERILQTLRGVQEPLAALEQKLSGDGGETALETEDHLLVRKALYFTSREVSHQPQFVISIHVSPSYLTLCDSSYVGSTRLLIMEAALIFLK